MYDHTLHCEEEFCRYYLQVFSTDGILKRHIKDFFKFNDKENL